MEEEFVKAVPRSVALRKLALYAALGVIVILFGEYILFPWMREYLAVKDELLLLARFKHVMLGVALGLLPPVVFMFRFSSRIIASKQFPYPGAVVFRDTRIQRGRLALLRGWFFRFAALFILACAVYMACLPYILFDADRVATEQRH